MLSAEFVRNPDANTAVYRWAAMGIDELTRQNKLTSLPFWIPNATTRRHQFKLVLLRGLVPSADPNNDAFGLIVELIPPPPPAATSSSPTSHGSDFPNGCVVTCEVLSLAGLKGQNTPPSDSSKHAQQQRRATHERVLCSTKAAVVDTNNAQISFPDFIPGDIVKDARYVSGKPASLTLQITIETGISVPLHQVAATAYSFFSSLSSSVSQLLGSTAQLVHESRENLSTVFTQAAAASALSNGRGRASGSNNESNNSLAEVHPVSSAAAGGGDDVLPAAVPPPWEQPPEEWCTRPAAWRALLCERLASLDGTYRHGVERTLSGDEVALLSEVGLSESDLWSLYTLFDFDRDVQENLLTAPVVRARRYALVPAKMKDEMFWTNYFWKVHCVGQCVTERQVSAVIAVLCTPPRALESDLFVTVEEVLRLILNATEISAVLGDFVSRHEAGESWCTVVAESARHCVAALQVCASQRTNLSMHTRQQLSNSLAELKATLSQYGTALSNPPSTPAVVPVPAFVSSTSTAGGVASAAIMGVSVVPLVECVQPIVVGGETKPKEDEALTLMTSPSKEEAAPTAAHIAEKTENEVGSTQNNVDHVDVAAAHELPVGAVPPSLTAAAPPAAAAAPPIQPCSEALYSTNRIEFDKMPWEEEDG